MTFYHRGAIRSVFGILGVLVWTQAPLAVKVEDLSFESEGYTFRPITPDEAERVAERLSSIEEDGNPGGLRAYIEDRVALAEAAPPGVPAHLVHAWAAWRPLEAEEEDEGAPGEEPVAWFIFEQPTHKVPRADGVLVHMGEAAVNALYRSPPAKEELFRMTPGYLSLQVMDAGFEWNLPVEDAQFLYRTLVSHLVVPWIGSDLAVVPHSSIFPYPTIPNIRPYAGLVVPLKDQDFLAALSETAPLQPEYEDPAAAFFAYHRAFRSWVQLKTLWGAGIEPVENPLSLRGGGEDDAEEEAEDGPLLTGTVPDQIFYLDQSSVARWRESIEDIAAAVQGYVARIQTFLSQELAEVQAQQAAEQEAYDAEYERLQGSECAGLRWAANVEMVVYARENAGLGPLELQSGFEVHLQGKFTLTPLSARALAALVSAGECGFEATSPPPQNTSAPHPFSDQAGASAAPLEAPEVGTKEEDAGVLKEAGEVSEDEEVADEGARAPNADLEDEE